MRLGSRPRLLFVLSAAVLLAGGIVLAVMQIRWVGEATRAEEDRLRVSLQRAAAQVRAESEDELRALLSLTRLSAEDIAAGTWDEIENNLDFWREYSRFPGLLEAVYVVRRPPADDAYVYSAGSGFTAGKLPAEVRSTLETIAAELRDQYIPAAAISPGLRLIVLPAHSGRASASGLVAVVVNVSDIYEYVVPFYMRQNLEGHPYRIVGAGTGRVLAESANLPGGAEPEAAVFLSGFSFGGSRLGREPRPPEEEFPFMLDPLLQPWLQRAQLDEGPSGEGPASAMADRGGLEWEARLEIFYPGGTIAGTMRRQAAMNIAVGLGIIGVFLAGLLGITRLYNRTARLRADEQEFVASVGHELRTPIAVIQSASENLSRGVVTDPARLPKYAGVIHGQIKRLSGMVESILLYSGLESGASRKPAVSDIELPALLADVSGPLEELAAAQGCTLRVVKEALPERIRSDAVALRLIVENLVVNAVRHAAPSAIVLEMGRRPFGELRISVEDCGPGIPAKEQAKVFEPFFRGEASAANQRPGSGLGLHLVKRVTAILGGRVSLESPYENLAGVRQSGCRFTVLLPLEESVGNGQG